MLDSEINYAQHMLKSLTRLGDEQPGMDAELLDSARKTAKADLDRLRADLRSTLDAHLTLRREVYRSFNPYWGPLFKQGTENSRFGEQVEDYACLYTSRVSNFLLYSPLQYFRGPREHMPHELTST